jgi:hypothetical protein
LKQIAGRAGRSNTIGYVTAVNHSDLLYIKDCMNSSMHTRGDQGERVDIDEIIVNGKDKKYKFTPGESEIKKAIIFPPIDVILDFAATLNNFYAKDKTYIPDDLVTILEKFKFFSQIDALYSFREIKTYTRIATALRVVPDASLRNVLMFTMAPIKVTLRVLHYTKLFLKDLVKNSLVLIPVDILLSVNNFNKSSNYMEDLQLFEDLHSSKYF